MPEISSAPSSLFYLCTGFHRSGTSLLAQALANGGMHMGNELMGASFSNPLGHVEDMPVVRLHDKIFEINGTDWRYHENSSLVKPIWFENYLQRYMGERLQGNSLCGLKDPRAAFFLNNWQVAGGDAMRYVLVYRHWSTSVNSLFNRASRHLINNSSPMMANKVNLRFWQQPELAFEMWRSTNNAILSFYRDNADKCLLISQDAFVSNNAAVQQLASKIGLTAECLNNDNFTAQLMTDTVPENLLTMVPDQLRLTLDETWSQLQAMADVPATALPQFKPQESVTVSLLVGCSAQAADTKVVESAKFDISSLDWQEALGFIARIPTELISSELFESLFNRPFTQSAHYQTLAKIAHKNGLYLYTRLSKMRAMHVEQGSWDVSKWGLFVEPGGQWLAQQDNILEQANPFSLRLEQDIAALDAVMLSSLLQVSWDDLIATLSQQSPTQLAAALQLVLLHRLITSAAEFEGLASLARQHKLVILAEFALLKALRLDYKAVNIMALGDLYFARDMLVKAHHCFAEAHSLTPTMVAVIARLADVSIALGDVSAAEKYLQKARQIQPNHRVVKLCQQRLDNLLKPKEPAQSSIATNMLKLFTMPLVANYEEVVDLTRQDIDAGAALDRYNQQLAFILRDNKRWLAKGISQLSPSAAECLLASIYKHWRKLWPAAVLQQALALPVGKGTNAVIFSPQKPMAEMKLAISLHLENIGNAVELFEFVNMLPYQADLLLTCPADMQNQLTEIASAYHSGSVFVETVARDKGAMQAWLSAHTTRQADYALICRIHDLENSVYPAANNWRLQLLFCLLGSVQSIEKIISSFKHQPALGLVIPPYHPHAAAEISSESLKAKVQEAAQRLVLPAPGAMYVYPAGSMYWYRPEAFKCLFAGKVALSDEPLLAKLLPLVAQQANFSTQMSHLLTK
jgi:tetratricopeptide (TPR) repeat protein